MNILSELIGLLKPARKHLRIRKPLRPGKALCLNTHFEISRGLSNLPVLAEHQVAVLAGLNGKPAIRLPTASAINSPRTFLGYSKTGEPIFLADHSHILVLGQTGSGKSVTLGGILDQAAAVGDPTILISMKEDDPTPIASQKHGADAVTKIGSDGQLRSSPYAYISFVRGQRTREI